jgi:hypothetical protein
MKRRAPFRRKAPLYYSFTTNGQTYELGKCYPGRTESLVYHFPHMGFLTVQNGKNASCLFFKEPVYFLFMALLSGNRRL